MRQSKTQNDGLMAWSVCLRRLLDDDPFHLPRKMNLHLENVRKHFTKCWSWCIWRSATSSEEGSQNPPKRTSKSTFDHQHRLMRMHEPPRLEACLPITFETACLWAKCLGKKDLPEPRTGLKLGLSEILASIYQLPNLLSENKHGYWTSIHRK